MARIRVTTQRAEERGAPEPGVTACFDDHRAECGFARISQLVVPARGPLGPADLGLILPAIGQPALIEHPLQDRYMTGERTPDRLDSS